jgi:hypothetical protein
MREDEPDGLLEPTLGLRADCGAEHDDLHQHVRATLLLWPLPYARWVGPPLVWLGTWRVRLTQRCLWERVERQVRADPAQRRVYRRPSERRASVRGVEQLSNRLRLVLVTGDEDYVGARRRVAELCVS